MKNLYNYITEQNASNSFRLVAVGDALCHKNLHEYVEKNGYSEIFKDYKLNADDLNFYNQESVISGKFKSFYKREQMTTQVHFGADESFAKAFLDKGFNMVSLANNHVLDIDEKGVQNSIDFWKSTNTIYAGQYAEEDRFKERIYEKNGIKFAFFAYTDKKNTKDNNPKYPYFRNDFDYELAKRDIMSIRDKVDLVIVSIHWGLEHSFTPNQDQRDIAKFLSDLGVDIVLGHHSHCVQCVDKIGKTLVAYSLGNFVASQETNRISTQIGLELTIDIKKTNNGITYIPYGRLTYLHRNEDRTEFKLMHLDKADNYLSNKDILLKQYWEAANKYNILRKKFNF